jgi:flagellar hook assembly protein FlgD
VNRGIASYELTDGRGGKMFHAKEMKGEGSFKITNSGLSKFSVSLIGDGQLPAEYALSQNYPNPFNPTTNVKYALPVQSKVTMEVYNVLGQRVRTLVNDDQAAGYHVAEWDGMGNAGQQLASGVYFLQISAKGTNGKTFSDTRKLVMLK